MLNNAIRNLRKNAPIISTLLEPVIMPIEVVTSVFEDDGVGSDTSPAAQPAQTKQAEAQPAKAQPSKPDTKPAP